MTEGKFMDRLPDLTTPLIVNELLLGRVTSGTRLHLPDEVDQSHV
jgi:hypothetical protein